MKYYIIYRSWNFQNEGFQNEEIEDFDLPFDILKEKVDIETYKNGAYDKIVEIELSDSDYYNEPAYHLLYEENDIRYNPSLVFETKLRDEKIDEILEMVKDIVEYDSDTVIILFKALDPTFVIRDLYVNYF